MEQELHKRTSPYRVSADAAEWRQHVAEDKKIPDGFKPYEDGKGRRYGLLFSVNGGAFAIAKVFSEKADKAADKNISTVLLGSLTIEYLALGMIAFTVVMVADIFAFGWGMKQKYVPDRFGLAGMLVLGAIGSLIIAGWILVAVKPGK